MAKDEKHSITCDARNCLYHKGVDTCTAKQIKVGCVEACCSDETKCSSFKMSEDTTHNYVLPT